MRQTPREKSLPRMTNGQREAGLLATFRYPISIFTLSSIEPEELSCLYGNTQCPPPFRSESCEHEFSRRRGGAVNDRMDRSPLHYEDMEGDTAKVIELINSGADVNAAEVGGYGPQPVFLDTVKARNPFRIVWRGTSFAVW